MVILASIGIVVGIIVYGYTIYLLMQQKVDVEDYEDTDWWEDIQ